MLAALTPSELSAIRDIAIARADLERRSPEAGFLRTSDSRREDEARAALRGRLAERIGALDDDARAELDALVRLGRGEDGHGWNALVQHCRCAKRDDTPAVLAADVALDAHIERGLLALQSHRR